LTAEVTARLQHELQVIAEQGFAPYFLIVWDIVRWARRQGIPVLGRGSAADSLVAYVLGITQVDPLAHGLYFERFLNPNAPTHRTSTSTSAGGAATKSWPMSTTPTVPTTSR
jgi:DNA polymerase III alpha subunit